MLNPRGNAMKAALLNALILLLVMLCETGWSQDSGLQSSTPRRFPYEALVKNEQAVTRSGPGELHYGTAALEAGTSVEVHRHDPGGWLAVRPTPGSFSLVPESAVEVTEPGVGRIVAEGTRAWVGTRLDPVEQPQWQIKLREGELVTLLGELSWPTPDGHSVIWYQIKPPAGEFRWIHRDDLERLEDGLPYQPRTEPGEVIANSPWPTAAQASDQMISVVEDIAASTPLQDSNTMPLASRRISELRNPVIGSGLKQVPSLRAEAFETPIAGANPDPVQLASYGEIEPTANLVEPQDDTGINQGWRRSRKAQQAAGSSSDLASREYRPPGAKNATLPFQQASRPLVATPRFADRDVSTIGMTRQLDSIRTANQSLPVNLAELEMRLTNEMIKADPADWQLQGLEEQAMRFAQSSNAGDQQWATRLWSKIKQCQQIQAGFAGTPGFGSPTGTTVSASAGANKTRVGFDDSQFDAIGYLNQLTRNQGSQSPQLVLQDDNGKITHLVEPVPGISLQRYLRKKIGVVGRRGFHRELNLNHVRVERAYPLQ